MGPVVILMSSSLVGVASSAEAARTMQGLLIACVECIDHGWRIRLHGRVLSAAVGATHFDVDHGPFGC